MAARPHTIDAKVVDPKRAVSIVQFCMKRKKQMPRDQAHKTEQNMSTKRLYVSGVREEHTEGIFEHHFSEFGRVTRVPFTQSIAFT
jgi:hypothetical protein